LHATRITSEEPGHLIERGHELALLGELHASVARAGTGQLVLIAGEAGVGKTSLVRTLTATSDLPCLSGACDSLFTPRPLGPIADVAEAAGGALEKIVDAGASPHEVATALLRELRDRRATILVLEDLHWADEATLDVFGILAGRVRSVPALVLCTYRDDELDRSHPLRLVLGGLATREAITRIELSPLSADAVAALAAPTGVDAVELHRTTGGNPFYVTEVLAGGAADIPSTVRDAVHARVARLDAQARELLDAAAVLPPPVELDLLEAVAGEKIAALDECLSAGLLTEQGGRLAFRHELARIALEDALPPHERAALHRAALAALAAQSTADLARLAHHADAAGDGEAVLRFAPAAGQHAASVSAHREAVAQYERALRFADDLPPGARAALLDKCIVEYRAIGEFRRAMATSQEAAREYARAGDTRKHAAELCQQAWLTSFVSGGSIAQAEELLHEAITMLEGEPDAPELLRAFGVLSGICLLQNDRDGLFKWTGHAQALAGRLGLPVPVYVHVQRAGIEFARGFEPARVSLEEATARAAEAHDDDNVGIAYGLLVLGAVRSRRHDLAESYIAAGRDYCVEHDLNGHTPYFDAWQAMLDLQQGRWAEAEAGAQSLLALRGVGPATALTLQTTARLRARRGQDGRHEAVEAARERAESSGALWLRAPAASTAAEAAWLDGRLDDVPRLTDGPWEALVAAEETWVAGELAVWRRRAGITDSVPSSIPDPYARELAGDALGAAALWDELDSPYEAALARAQSHDEDALRLALDQLRTLGAEPAAAIVARKLRSLGAKGLPRGPRQTTRDNPAGLTSREVEVLALVADGLRNGDIAQRLFLSEKTVAHHVSAILRKLDVRTRGEAGAAAVRLGLTRD
jgi:ATP/maltotriose-dependent transcriptional regulator MalT